MGRPRTLAEVARRHKAGEDFSLLLREFLDEFYGGVRRGDAARVLLRSRSLYPTCKNTPRLALSVNIWPADGT